MNQVQAKLPAVMLSYLSAMYASGRQAVKDGHPISMEECVKWWEAQVAGGPHYIPPTEFIERRSRPSAELAIVEGSGGLDQALYEPIVLIREPNKYQKGQGVLAVGPMALGETHYIPWLGHSIFECVRPGTKLLFRKHLRRAKSLRPLWWHGE